jgi:serine/threonine protein kinase
MRVCSHCHLLLDDSVPLCPHDGGSATPATVPPVPAELHARFLDFEAYAQGQTGTCYLATQKQSGYRGLLKVIPLAAMDTAERARLKRELRKQTRLVHDGLVRLFDGGEAGEELWLFREFVEGVSLAQRVRKLDKLELDEALAITAQVASALDELQRSGLLHRDVKPGHVILQPTPGGLPVAKLIDAGIAAKLPTSTVFGLHGTPAYISPEQVSGKLVSFRSDLYALGCVLFEMLTGRPPFPDGDVAAVLEAHKNTAPPLPERELPTAAQGLLRAMLAKEPRQRPFSAQQVRRTLEPLLPKGLKLPALSARTEGVSRVPAPAPSGAPAASKPPREDITQEVELEQIETGTATPERNTIQISDSEFDALEASAQEPRASALSLIELDELDLEDDRGVHAVPEAGTPRAAAAVADAPPADAAVVPPPMPAPEAVPPSAAETSAAPVPEPEPVRASIAPARASVDFDVESLFDDAVPADPTPAEAPASEALPAAPHALPPEDAAEEHASDRSRSPHIAPIEADPEGTVVIAIPGVRRKPTWQIGAGIAVLVVVLLLMRHSGRGPESNAPPPVAESAAHARAGAMPPPEAAPRAEPDRAAQPSPTPPTPNANNTGESPAPASAPTDKAAPVAAEPHAERGAPAAAESGADRLGAARASRAERLAKAEQFKTLARAHYQAGRFKEAGAAYQKAAESDPSDAGAVAGLGAARLAQDDAKGAIDAYSRAVRLQPQSSGFHAALGRAYLQRGDRDRARAAYERAIKLDPTNGAAKTALAKLR